MSNWQATNDQWNQGSFQSPVPAPNVDPAAAPVVCVQFGSAWLPYILGSLFQLTQPVVWDPTSPGSADAVQQAESLMGIFSAAGVCTDMLTFQFTSGCGLQYSLDGGTTWIDVPGWSTFAPGCFTGPAGPAGSPGAPGPASIWRLSGCDLQYSNDAGTTWTTATGWSTPAIQGCIIGEPPNPGGSTTAQAACNIAAYLAADILQVSMAQMVSNYNAARNLVDSVTALFELIPGVDAVFGIFVGAAAILYNYYTSATIADFTAASTDATLLQNMKCAIYSAISADGMVDASNFATLVSNVGAISYAHADVITALVAYLNALGLTGLEQLQLLGGAYVGDCSGCGGSGSWCYLFDFTASDQGWSQYAPGAAGTYVLGTGWTSEFTTGSQGAIDIKLDNAGISTVTAIKAKVKPNKPITASDLCNIIPSPFSQQCNTITVTGPDAFGYYTWSATGYTLGGTRIELYLVHSGWDGSANEVIVQSIELGGTGTNPFGADNCSY